MSIEEYLDNIKGMIDDLKAMTADLGLNNTGDEYKIISELFTYKFLNDKLVQEFENRKNKDESYQEFIDFADADTARINERYLLSNLFQRQNEPEFPALFDQAFKDISELNKEIYSIETTTGLRKPLLEPLSVYLRDEDKEAELAKRSINILNKHTFKGVYSRGWDYFSSIFEYLIKDYNKDSGSYAEYYTPAFAGSIMANILLNDTSVDKVSVYDPAAGSGTLLLSMANAIGVKNCTLYSQDRSQKSTQFLRINLILNNLTHSLSNVIEGNTMTKPSHLEGEKLKQFDFIVSNPPFTVDFSADVATMQSDTYGRFFAGIPNIPRVDKSDMAIYLTFLQHILASLNDKGKAAVVVPTGFLDKNKRASKIAYSIREKLIQNNWLIGTISMPSNIFANTGTNVSILFIDKAKTNSKVFLFDASRFGEKVSLSDGQRTLLSENDINRIINIFKKKEIIEDTSVYIETSSMKEKSYSFSPGQYYQVKMEYVELSQDDFYNELANHKSKLEEYFKESNTLQSKILASLGDIIYEQV